LMALNGSFSFTREMRTLFFMHVLDLVSDFFKGTAAQRV